MLLPSILQGLVVVEDEDSENHLEEVEVDKSILQTSSSQLLYKICENGSCKLDDESIVCQF